MFHLCIEYFLKKQLLTVAGYYLSKNNMTSFMAFMFDSVPLMLESTCLSTVFKGILCICIKLMHF